jgi:hypothetical protein
MPSSGVRANVIIRGTSKCHHLPSAVHGRRHRAKPFYIQTPDKPLVAAKYVSLIPAVITIVVVIITIMASGCQEAVDRDFANMNRQSDGQYQRPCV